MKDYLRDNVVGPVGVGPVLEIAHFNDLSGWALLPPANKNQPVAGLISGHHAGHHIARRLAGVTVHTGSQALEQAPGQVKSQSQSQSQSLYRLVGKRVFDILFVLATLPVSVPVIAICAVALWIEGRSPFYRQDRLGKGGARFPILKLRTMVRNADAILEQYLENDPQMRADWDATQKLKKDPRITRIGGFLRSTSLDELPQLWNVLKGEMSLVGPRPMMPQQLPLYGDPQAYFAVQPGITGIWQVSARNEALFSDRAVLDREYFANLSLAFDLGLLLKTVGVVVRRTGY